MNILAIETSSLLASVAYADQTGIVYEKKFTEKRMHDLIIVGALRDILIDVNKKPEDIQAIAVSAGPGSFTGIRIGVAAAKGFAFAGSIPVLFVPTLDAIALDFAARTSAGTIVATQFSHKTNLWYKVFDSAGNALDEDAPKLVDRNSLPYFPDATYIGTAIALAGPAMKTESGTVPTAGAIARVALHAGDRLLTAPLYAATFAPTH